MWERTSDWAWQLVPSDNGVDAATRKGVSFTLTMDAPVQYESVAASFVAIVEAHATQVWRTLRYFGVREADLPDASQEVFLVVHRRLPEFRGEAKLSTWIYGICFRVAQATRRRTRADRQEPVSDPPTEAIEACQHADYERLEARSLLTEALNELPEEQRAVFVLREIEELPMNEIASLVGCPLFTAYSRLRLAKKRLRERLQNPEEHS